MDFIIQEFMEHDQSARMIMIGDKLLAANLRGQPKEKDEFRTNSHLGSETEKYEPSEEEISVAKKIVELFGCRFCAIDYLITEDKEIIVLEVNGSPGLENIQKNWPDKDLPKTVVEYVKNLHGSSDDSSTETSIEVVTEPENKDSGEIKSDEPESKTMIDEIESATIHRITSNVTARVDTGAKYCSLHVDRIIEDGNYVKFTRGDVTYKVPVIKYVKIRNANTQESVSRPVVMLDISVKGFRANQVEFTLNDRSNMKYEVLIGRNALQIWGLPVLVSQDNIQKTGDESSIEQVEEE
jgi:hypothetical protein